MAVYGTNCLKFGGESFEEAAPWLTRELHIVQPKLVVVMGQDALGCLTRLNFPLAKELEETQGTIQQLTPTVEALLVPDIDTALDEQAGKKAFWADFKAIGPWWSDLPPY